MDDLISRSAATRAAVISVRDYLGNIDSERNIHIEEGLYEVPAVDAVPVIHARWIDYKDDHQCSACKEHTIFDAYAWKAIQFEFCPNCGAKMDGEWRDDDA